MNGLRFWGKLGVDPNWDVEMKLTRGEVRHRSQ